jgi:iron(III) transport system ATP-binding protein
VKGLHVHGVSHAFDGHQVLDNVSLTIPAGELVCLLGPSGCGKTTLLRIAAGLERLQHGGIIIDETVVAAPDTHVAPEHRGIGLMFQDYALFPHLTILRNATFGLARPKSAGARRRALEMLDQVGMAAYADKYPHMLSGGQQQRVALARALAPEPRLLLLDEPFSGLEVNLRMQIREETVAVLKRTGVATLMVTHDPEEAMFMADRIKILGADGRVLQSGRPADIYYKPADEFVARLFGHMNYLQGVVMAGRVAGPLGPIQVDGVADGTAVHILVREEGVVVSPAGADADSVPVEVVESRLLGRSSHLRLRPLETTAQAAEFHARVPGAFDPAEAGPMAARLDPRHTFVYPEA